MTFQSDDVTHALKIADLAAEAAMGYFRGRLGTEFKADDSPVTEADKHVETLVRNYLSTHYPDHGIFGEEHGIQGGERPKMWIIDPIDGTRSFLSGHPLFGFLLGHLVDGLPDLGVIGMPALNEVFLGVKGQGASLNGTAIRSSEQTDLGKAILYINEGEKIYTDHPDVFAHLLRTGRTRRFSYDCYPHALLAAGHVDAVVDYDLQPYDYMAVSIVIQEAGGFISDWQGQPLSLQSDGRVVSAATSELHAQLLELVGA